MSDAAEAVLELRGYLTKNGLKFTQQRQLVTEVFYNVEDGEHHPTVDELYHLVRARDARIGYATVYRTLKLLEAADLAHAHRLGGNQTRYEPRSDEHHDHLICVVCGAILEFEDERIERLQEEIASRFGFELTDHRMVLYGRPRLGLAAHHECDEGAEVESK
jgi:Fur family ferric uptake transcriptional regulator